MACTAAAPIYLVSVHTYLPWLHLHRASKRARPYHPRHSIAGCVPMSCPFSGASAAQGSEPGAASGCPFARQQPAAAPAHAEAPGAPADGGAHGGGAAAAAPPQPAVCPYGFSSGGKGRHLGELDCILCGALAHDAVATQPCGHRFCGACITGARDCPVCGADIDGAAPAQEMRDMVSAYLEGHGRDAAAVAKQQHALHEAAAGSGGAAAAAAAAAVGGDGSPASFFLFHGLKSLLGGNTDAALYRLGRCRDLLLAELAEASRRDVAGALGAAAAAHAAACRLGAVCGSLGDCWRRRGDLGAAGAELCRSVAHLRPHAGGDAEAAHTLSVTLGKLGDLEYYKAQAAEAAEAAGQEGGETAAAAAAAAPGGGGAAAAALPLYAEAVELRRALCGPLSGGRAGPGATLDLVSALAKVADAQEALGDAGAATRSWHQAAAELHELKLAAGGALEGAAAAKMRTLEELLALRGHGVEGP
ncbi:MAG: hypothetical protein J3K34DRAFT_264045 [Monoraphidium minutum]|nr:MAG: hypothetical protein J3K34DRAFT_264045 [Monoraphidium minutum]